MSSFEVVQAGVLPEQISAALFDGRLLLFHDLAEVGRLTERVRAIVEEVFETRDPPRAEAGMEPKAFRALAVQARRAVEADAATNTLWRAVLGGVGYAPEACHLDRLRLRVVPSRQEIHGRIIRPLPAHRDSWGSGIMAQINWWLALYSLAETRTMVVWPEAFREPVENDSATWDYDTLMRGDTNDYPMLPTTPTPSAAGVPVVIEPGTLLAFSAAHLHASVADGSGISRLSLDTRTVWQPDVVAGRGAPNVDGAAQQERWDWFGQAARNGGALAQDTLSQNAGAA